MACYYRDLAKPPEIEAASLCAVSFEKPYEILDENIYSLLYELKQSKPTAEARVLTTLQSKAKDLHCKAEFDNQYKAYKQEQKNKERAQIAQKAIEENGLSEKKWIDVHLNEKTGDVTYSLNIPELVKHIKNDTKFLFVSDNSREKVDRYVYENGVYRHVSDEEFKGNIKKEIPEFLHKQRDIDETFKLLCCDNDIKRTLRDELNTDENIINFKNGIYSIKTHELLPHSPDILSTIQIPCNYSPEKKDAPVFTRFIHTLMSDDRGKIDFLLAFMALAISNIDCSRFKKALFMVGPGNTGKSQVKKLVEMLLGVENYATVDLLELESRWGTAATYNKRMAGCDDLPYTKVPELSVFKQVTGGDCVKAEYKGGQLFSFKYRGILWFCTNKMPRFGGDKGKHVYDRMIILECNNVIPEEKQDKFLIDKMYAESESIINILLLHLQKLHENNYALPISSASREAKQTYIIDNSSVRRFFKECCCERPKEAGRVLYDSVTTKRMYDVYRKWCNDNNCRAASKTTFKEELTNITGMSEHELVKRNMNNTFYIFTLKMDVKNDYGVYDTINMEQCS